MHVQAHVWPLKVVTLEACPLHCASDVHSSHAGYRTRLAAHDAHVEARNLASHMLHVAPVHCAEHTHRHDCPPSAGDADTARPPHAAAGVHSTQFGNPVDLASHDEHVAPAYPGRHVHVHDTPSDDVASDALPLQSAPMLHCRHGPDAPGAEAMKPAAHFSHRVPVRPATHWQTQVEPSDDDVTASALSAEHAIASEHGWHDG